MLLVDLNLDSIFSTIPVNILGKWNGNNESGSFSYFRGNQDAFAPKLDLLVLPARPDLFISGDHVDVTIHGLYIDWQGNRGLWRHIVEENKGVKIQNLIQCN